MREDENPIVKKLLEVCLNFASKKGLTLLSLDVWDYLITSAFEVDDSIFVA